MTNVVAGDPKSPAQQLFIPAGWNGEGQPPLYTAAQVAALTAATAQPAEGAAKVNWWEVDGDKYDASISPMQPAQGVAYAELPDERAAFEAQFPVPGGVSWNGSNYVVKDDYLNSYRCDRFVGQWAAWQARASHGQAPAGAADNQRELLEDAAFLLRKYRRLCVEIGRGDSQHLDRIEAAAVAVRALYAEPTPTAQAAPAAGNWIAADDVKRLVRQLDVALNGEDGAAMQASLCDIVAQVEHESAKRGRPVLAAAPTPAAQADSVPQKETPDETLWQWYLANKDVEIPHSRAVALRVLQGAIRVFGNADSVPEAAALSQAARDVLAERKRQINAEGWTPEHDDEQHLPGELALAAASYVCADENDAPPAIWPWALNWWKPRDRRRNLTKAGALILAEMERIDRAARKQGGTHDS